LPFYPIFFLLSSVKIKYSFYFYMYKIKSVFYGIGKKIQNQKLKNKKKQNYQE